MTDQIYTLERLSLAINRMRASAAEFGRVVSMLTRNHGRTLRADIKDFETRLEGRKLNQEYVRAVCNAFYVTSQSKLHTALMEAIVAEPSAQRHLDNMVGKYDAYWPSKGGTFDKFPFEIVYTDKLEPADPSAVGIYSVSDRTVGKDHNVYGHDGFAFLIRQRVHVIEPVNCGLRSMIFHFEEFPARNPVKGIITNVLGLSDADLAGGEQIFSAHFIAFHQNDQRHYGNRVVFWPSFVLGIVALVFGWADFGSVFGRGAQSWSLLFGLLLTWYCAAVLIYYLAVDPRPKA